MMGAANYGKDDRQPILILLYTAVILTIFVYYGSAKFYTNHISSIINVNNQFFYFLSSFVLLGIIPLLIWIFGFRANLADMGLSLGNYKESIIFALIGIPVMILLAYISAKNPAFRAEYPLYRGLLENQSGIGHYWLIYGLYYIGWEFFFRGFMLFGLKNKFGKTYSILIQTIPSCLIHIGKPDAEIFSSIVAGIVFGWVAFRCRSLWPVFIWHWCLGVALDYFIIYG
jgi:membrane protease YdiL (CAAX protease family)